jgi:hypothetical protein
MQISAIQIELTYGTIDRYWFWRLDYYLWESRKEIIQGINHLDIADKYIFQSKEVKRTYCATNTTK